MRATKVRRGDMNHIETIIKSGKTVYRLSGEIINGKVTKIKIDGVEVETPEQRKARIAIEKDLEHYERILMNEYRIKEGTK